jgi:hypothetical protein
MLLDAACFSVLYLYLHRLFLYVVRTRTRVLQYCSSTALIHFRGEGGWGNSYIFYLLRNFLEPMTFASKKLASP